MHSPRPNCHGATLQVCVQNTDIVRGDQQTVQHIILTGITVAAQLAALMQSFCKPYWFTMDEASFAFVRDVNIELQLCLLQLSLKYCCCRVCAKA